MTMVDYKEAFKMCEYPFYKDVIIEDQHIHCTLYSLSTPAKSTVTFSLMNFDEVIHKLSLEVIKIRAAEYMDQQQQLINKQAEYEE